MLLEDTFSNSFDLSRFVGFVRELLNEFGLNPRGWPVWKEYNDYIDSYQLLGSYKQGKKILDVLVVKLKKPTSIERARTMQRNFVAKYLGNTEKDAALVAFYEEDSPDWRFSFIKMEYSLKEGNSGKVNVERELTPAKRYSFLVGKNEPNYTCKKQFLELVMTEETMPLIDDIETAFSIEKVTKDFFNEYKELYIELKESLDKIIENDSHVKKEFEDNDISSIDFCKKLLGQIVFIYFLQKKGWLGVRRLERGEFQPWGSGSKNFLRRLFNKDIVSYDNFFNDILEPLFYEALATQRDDDYYSRFNCKIPFLNGGLFEPINDYDWVATDILLDNAIFQRILDTFDRYNFTIKEDEPLEKEVAIDPEMLGKVFENLLEIKDRKSTGRYYTPREIVHYMCQQSLINYLETNIDIPHEDIEKFIRFGEFTNSEDERHLIQIKEINEQIARFPYRANELRKELIKHVNNLTLPKSIIENKKMIDSLLKNVKIADPAVGSGAFPVGMMTLIVKARSVLTPFFPEEDRKGRTDYNLKRETIENCLYGVDIDSSAVDIAKLRFWLSLIVDELDMKNIKPLPNLDHKIMVGNSLLEEFEGVKLFDESLFGETKKNGHDVKQIDDEMKKLYLELGDIHKGLKKSDDRRVEEIKKELKKLEKKKKDILAEPKDDSEQATLQETLSNRIKQSKVKLNELKRLQKQFFNEQDRKLKKQYAEQINRIEWELIEETLKERGNEDAMKKLKQYQKSRSKPFFLWKLYFAEVFQCENPGFDIVIANPPYLEARSKEFLNEIKTSLQKAVREKYPSEYHLIPQGSDLLVYFYLKSLEIINSSGFISFITQNAWLDTEYGHKFQRFLSTKTNIVAIIDSDFKYFDTANINTVVTFFSGKNVLASNKVLILNFHENIEKVPYTVSDLIKNNCDENYVTCKVFDQSDLINSDYKWGFLIHSDKLMLNIISKLEKAGVTVDKIKDVNVSIGQGLNLSRASLIPEKFVNDKAIFIPIMTTEDGAPFILKKTSMYLASRTKIDKSTKEKLKTAGFDLFNSDKTTKVSPTLILPRGIGRHYCSMNETNGYSSSGVDVYIEPRNNIIAKRLWIFLNSSLAWLLRETTGRKNLGGGMLKAEAIDLKALPIYLELDEKYCDKVLEVLEKREATNTLEEMTTSHHKQIDKIVFDLIGLNDRERNYVTEKLSEMIRRRSEKSRTRR